MKIKAVTLSVFFLILTAAIAQASTITLTGIKGASLSYEQTGYLNTEIPPTYVHSGTPGEFILTSDDLDILPFGYCVEQGVDIWPNEDFFVSSFDDVSGNYINAAWLIDTYYGVMTEDYQRAALQLAIWDVLFASALWDGGDGTIDDIINIVPTETQAYFDLIKADYDANYNAADILGKGYMVAELQWSAHPTYPVQDIIVRVVPEPGTIILFSIGLLGLAGSGRKRD
mgnify:CR=1 FL=1